MATQKRRRKTCTCQQLKGVAGLGFLTAVAFVIAEELPQTWLISLAIGLTVGLGLAAASAAVCFYTPHIDCGYKRGTGVLYGKCEMPALLGTYHCEVCEVCVPAHSHHSDWLNSCIGASNYSAYLLCLFSVGAIAICQLLASTVLLALIATDQDTARRIIYRYSLLDQGYLYRVSLFFHFLISVTLATTTWASFACHLSKAAFQWSEQRKTHRQAQPVQGMNRPYPSSDTGLPMASNVSCKVQSESFDLHALDMSGIGDQSCEDKSGTTQISHQRGKG